MQGQEQTYRQQQKRQPFDWNEFLRAGAPRRSQDQWEKAYALAGNWVTCAVGNQCALLPRTGDGTPTDPELAWLGNQFYLAISNKHLRLARKLLQQIEQRSSWLLLGLQLPKPENP